MKIQGLKVAVTGGAGFIGSHLVQELLKRDNHVHILDDFSSGSRENLAHLKHQPKLSILEGDVRNEKDLDHAFRGMDVVFHLATHCVRLSLSEPLLNHDVNSTGTLKALLSAKKENVKRFIYCSSSEVFGHSPAASTGALKEDDVKVPTTLYGASKLTGEHYTLSFHKTYGLPGMVLRPFNSYGPRSHLEGAYGEVIPRMSVRIRAGLSPLIYGNGKQTRDFTFVKDTALALIQGAEKDELLGEVIHLAHGQEISIESLALLLLKLLKRTDLTPEKLEERPGDLPRLGADTTKAQHFGIELGTSLEEGLAQYLEWQESQGWDYVALAKKLSPKNWNRV